MRLSKPAVAARWRRVTWSVFCGVAVPVLMALQASPSMAAVVRLANTTYDSAPGYQVSASGTDQNGQTASASADEVRAQVLGNLIGPNWPPFLTAGFPVFADTQTGGPFGTAYTVQGVRPGADMTFVWRLDGSYTGVADKQAVRVDAGWRLYNGRQLFGGSFGGLSFVDTSPAAGDFAGSLEGRLACQDNGSSFDDDCGSDWNGFGTRFVSVRDNNASGWLGASISVGGSGEDTRAQYGIELIQVLVAAEDLLNAALSTPEPLSLAALSAESTPNRAAATAFAANTGLPGAFVQFASGRALAITGVGIPNAVPEPGTIALAGLGMLMAGWAARRR